MVMVDGIAVHAVVMGDGPNVVLIHGSSGNTRDMTFSLAPILAENFRVIVFDRPGLGYSNSFNSDGETIEEQALILQKAAAQLGAEKPIVAGQSYGGSVSLAWAVTRPDNISALVLIAPAAIPWETPLDGFNKLASTEAGNTLALPLITAFVPEWYVEQALDKVFAPQKAPAADTTVKFAWHAEQLVDQIPDAELIELPGIGHMPQVVAAPEVASAIDRAADRAGLR